MSRKKVMFRYLKAETGMQLTGCCSADERKPFAVSVSST